MEVPYPELDQEGRMEAVLGADTWLTPSEEGEEYAELEEEAGVLVHSPGEGEVAKE
jgi:hypothetical protein